MRTIEGARARQERKWREGRRRDAGVEDVIDESYVPPRNAEGLRTDGPTIEVYVAAGYSAAGYPPEDFAPVDSEGWTAEQELRAAVPPSGEPAADGD